MADAKTYFEQKLPARIQADPAKFQNVNAVFLVRVTGDAGGTWTIRLKDEPRVEAGDTGGADCSIELSDADWDQLSENPASAMPLYFQGKLKVTGNVMLATKLQHVFG